MKRRLPMLARALLALYPRRFRAGHEAETSRTLQDEFADIGREPSIYRRWIWTIRVILDLVRGLPAEWAEALTQKAPRTGAVRNSHMPTIEHVIATLRHSGRRLRKEPSFTATAILTLALGIGATTAVFSLVNAFFFRGLPYPNADRVVIVNVRLGERSVPASYLDYVDWKEQATTLETLTLTAGNSVTHVTDDDAVLRNALFVAPSYFQILGARPQIGRLLNEDDNRVIRGHPVAVMSHSLWQEQFGGDPSTVGTSVRLNGTAYTVVGIMAEDFLPPFPPADGYDFWIPVMQWPLVDAFGDVTFDLRQRRLFAVIATLRPGVDQTAAENDLTAVAARLAEAYPATNANTAVEFTPVRDVIFGSISGPTLALLAGAGFLLLVGCINVASLLLVRSTTRSHETALRLALGSSRAGVTALLGAEVAWLTLAAAGLGMLIAHLSLGGLIAFSGISLPQFAKATVDLPVFLATFGISVIVAGSVSLLPGMFAARANLRDELVASNREVGGRRSAGLRHALIVLEVAMTVVILIGAGLMVRSFRALNGTAVGFTTESVLTARADLAAEAYPDDEALRPFARSIVERLNAVPGIVGTDVWSRRRPGEASSFTTLVRRGDVVASQGEAEVGRQHFVTAGAIERLGLEVVEGRGISEADNAGAEAAAVISESMARDFWPGQSALGQYFRRFAAPGSPLDASLPWVRVVGVVRDAKLSGRNTAPGSLGDTRYDVFYSWEQVPQRFLVIMAYTSGDAEAVTNPLRAAVREVDPALALYSIRPLTEVVADEVQLSRFIATMIGAFGGFTLLLAAVGLYGVLAYNVSRRAREIGLRTALGASSRVMVMLFVRQGMSLTVVGIGVGVAAAGATTRLAAGLLFGITSSDIVSFIAGPSVLLLVALGACYIPARRALGVDPMITLRGS